MLCYTAQVPELSYTGLRLTIDNVQHYRTKNQYCSGLVQSTADLYPDRL